MAHECTKLTCMQQSREAESEQFTTTASYDWRPALTYYWLVVDFSYHMELRVSEHARAGANGVDGVEGREVRVLRPLFGIVRMHTTEDSSVCVMCDHGANHGCNVFS